MVFLDKNIADWGEHGGEQLRGFVACHWEVHMKKRRQFAPQK
jgi:hypothetical protein